MGSSRTESPSQVLEQPRVPPEPDVVLVVGRGAVDALLAEQVRVRARPRGRAGEPRTRRRGRGGRTRSRTASPASSSSTKHASQTASNDLRHRLQMRPVAFKRRIVDEHLLVERDPVELAIADRRNRSTSERRARPSAAAPRRSCTCSASRWVMTAVTMLIGVAQRSTSRCRNTIRFILSQSARTCRGLGAEELQPATPDDRHAAEQHLAADLAAHRPSDRIREVRSGHRAVRSAPSAPSDGAGAGPAAPRRRAAAAGLRPRRGAARRPPAARPASAGRAGTPRG